MNTKINPDSMVSSKGYALCRLHHGRLQYKVKSKVLTVEIGKGYRKFLMFKFPIRVVHLSQVRAWDTPYDGELISQQELVKIKDDIREGLKFLGVKCPFQ